jgi:hypothetical protein
MISIHSGFSKGLALTFLVVQLYDPIVLAFAPKQCNVPTSRHHDTAIFMNGQFRSTDDWAKEMRALQRAQRAQEQQEMNVQAARDKFYEEQLRMDRIAELVAEKKALDQAMAREKIEAREAEKYAKNYAVAKVIEEKRRKTEARKWEQAEAKRALQQARAEAIVKLKAEKANEINDRDREAARARAFMQAKAAAIDGGSMQGNFDPYEVPSQRQLGKTQYPSPSQVQYTPSRNNNKNSYRNNQNQGPPATFFYQNNQSNQNQATRTNQNLYQNNLNQAASTANDQNLYQSNRNQTPPSTYDQNPYQNNRNQAASTGYNQNPFQNNQSQAVPTTYNQNSNQNPYQNNRNQAASTGYNQNPNQNNRSQAANTGYNQNPYQNNRNQAASTGYNQNPYQNNQNQQTFANGNLPPVEALNSLLDIAITAAIEAGQIVVSNMSSAGVSDWKGNPRDLLTEIDPKCQRVIKNRILNRFPNHDFLGDSNKDASASALDEKLRNGRSDYLWIVDPIDGKNMTIFLFNLRATVSQSWPAIHNYFWGNIYRHIRFCSWYATMRDIYCMCIQGRNYRGSDF